MPCYRVVVLLDGAHFAPIISARDKDEAELRARALAGKVFPQAQSRVTLPPRLLHGRATHYNWRKPLGTSPLEIIRRGTRN